MIRTTITAAMLALLAGLGPAALAQDLTGHPTGIARGEAVNGSEPGMDYHEVRARLEELGWAGAHFTDPMRCSGRKAVCEAYPEAWSCSGTGLAPCSFVFFAHGWNGFTRVLIVTTLGEELEGETDRPVGEQLTVSALTWASPAEAGQVAPFFTHAHQPHEDQ